MELTAISSKQTSLFELILIGVVAFVCLAPCDLLAAPTSPESHLQLQQQQQQQQLQLQQQQQQQEAELMVLDRLAKQQQEAQLKLQSPTNKNTKQFDYDKQLKSVLKRKLHKMVDSLVDEQFASSTGDVSAVSQPIQRYREKVQPQQHQQQLKKAISEMDGNPNEPIGFYLKKRPSLDQQDSVGLSANQLDGPMAADQAHVQQPTVARQPSEQHLRNILKDGFGIVRDSIFTTNNHLGHKGVPKFGSDDTL